MKKKAVNRAPYWRLMHQYTSGKASKGKSSVPREEKNLNGKSNAGLKSCLHSIAEIPQIRICSIYATQQKSRFT